MDIYEPDENGIGEIIARGENIMLGYYEKKKLRTSAFTMDGSTQETSDIRIRTDTFIHRPQEERNRTDEW